MNGLPLQALLMLWIIFSANGAPYSSESNASITLWQEAAAGKARASLDM